MADTVIVDSVRPPIQLPPRERPANPALCHRHGQDGTGSGSQTVPLPTVEFHCNSIVQRCPARVTGDQIDAVEIIENGLIPFGLYGKRKAGDHIGRADPIAKGYGGGGHASGEIYEALRLEGVAVNGKKPLAVVASYLSHSDMFDAKRGEGYGLASWSAAPAEPRPLVESDKTAADCESAADPELSSAERA